MPDQVRHDGVRLSNCQVNNGCAGRATHIKIQNNGTIKMKVTTRQYKRFRELVYHECGITLTEGKQQLLQARLAKRLRKTGIKSVDEYLKMLRNDKQEMIDFIDVISTNHTYFFRESGPFEQLQKNHRSIWCAASSSGEEPYSIAIYCLERGFRPTILATDISTNVLQIGNMAVYPDERARNLDVRILRRYFQKGHGKWKGHIRVRDDVKKIVTFKRLNLVTEKIPNQYFDVIFCRNVMIYFDNTTKENLINKHYDGLRSGGYYIIGGAESLNNLKHRYKYVKPSVYRKA